jgi:RNA polymerase sigma-70 factor (ECF subfamily)
MDNLDLILKAQNGDTSAFGQLYDIFAERLFRFIKAKVTKQHQAEDILQEVFIKAWQALPQYKAQGGHFSAWLYRIATNATTDYFRKIYRQPATVELKEQLEIAGSLTSAEEVTRETDMEAVRKILPSLPARYRQVLELRFIQDFSVKETAGILGTTGLAVRLAQHRALKKLRELMEKQYAAGYQKI